MKRIVSTYCLVFSLLATFSSLSTAAQDLTGIWKGYFISDAGEYYKLEFQVAQGGSYGVSGVSYSYLDVRFYGKATMTGNFIKTSSSFKIREIKTVEVKSSLGGGTCIMNYNFKYSRSGKEEFLEGTYLGKYEGRYARPDSKWGDCGGGKVYLRKVTQSDFYIEPFLRNKVKTDTKPVIINQPPVKKDSSKVKTPAPVTPKPVVTQKPPVTNKKPVVTTKPPVTNKPVTTPTTNPVTKTKTDSLKTKINTPVTKVTPPLVIPKPAVLKNRSNELVKVLTVPSADVTIKLFDNGEIDDDTISVYYDNKLVLSAKRLTASPLVVKLRLEDENIDHELVMVAENLGRIPPNTSLMIVESGGQRFDVRISSTEQKNAMVKFRLQRPK
ncbi:MAG: hypothetical protein JNM19_07715 [Chitinophagaceae bacterium]|nr:hypothetical protein [Chitinophagaceae bacterium]